MGDKIYPIGIQNFEKIRNEGYYYVDKTALIYRLVKTGSYYFLSRPRRFGKSLLISTLEAYFLGKKELFEGLAMAQLEKNWIRRPVLHLDLNIGKYDAPDSLDKILEEALSKWEITYGTGVGETTLALRFKGIVERASQQSGQRVAILVDEYDKPLLQAIGNKELQSAYRNTLKPFYGVLKTMDGYIQFAMLTGVTKFGKVSVFSDLNQLNDISMDFSYATLCGITPNELTAVFEPEIHQMAQRNQSTEEEIVNEMIRQYDGYHFHPDGEGVLNPFSVLNAFDKLEFGNYWFQTGTPTFLVELLKKSDYDLRLLIDGIEAPASSFTEYRMNTDNPIPLIYQSGYLTIKEYDKEFRNYMLGFPNEEVKYGFLGFLLPFYTTLPGEERGFYIGKFVQELRQGNIDAFMTRLRAFFADFPYELNAQTERHYQVVFYLVFKLMGQFVDAEVRSATGRADAVVKTPKYIYVFEFKLDGSTEQALQQIDDRGYLIPYTADSRQLVKVGVNFNAEKKYRGMED